VPKKEPVSLDKLTHLTAKQKQNVKTWMELQDTLNRGEFGDAMDKFFHPEMTYGNPNRPDLGSYKSWKTSPMELYKRFPPSHYVTLDATAKGDDEIWVYCHHYGKHTGGRYMGIDPVGSEINVEWFSTVKFKDGKIIRIFSIADVLGMMISVGRIDPKVMPVDPYK
jgi:SnoaL-like polyketide cyclase